MLNVFKSTFNLDTFDNTKCAEIYCHPLKKFSIICSYCQLKLFEFDDFVLHFKNVHFEDSEPPLLPDIKIKCDDEETPTDLVNTIELHEQLQDIQKIPSTDMDFKEASEDKDICSSSSSDIDNDGHTNNEEYDSHKNLKTTSKKYWPAKYKCNECDKTYKFAKFLQHHINKCHNKNNIFKCTQCDSKFHDELALNSHAQSVHNGFFCDQCGKTYKSNDKLKQHSLMHTGERNFVCDYENCSKAFFNRGHLNLHKRRAHTMESNYICETCGYRTKQKQALEVHNRTHTGEKPFGCKQCDRSFNSKSSLKEHMPIHRTERPHKCEICSATFARPKALYHHKYLHLGIKKFVCKICGKAYAQAAGLAGHMRQHKSELEMFSSKN